jgi:feruloyl esterase
MLTAAWLTHAQQPTDAAQRCEALRTLTVARITSAAVVAMPTEHCEIKGEIPPINPDAPPIRFQVNLPTDWNGKALHMGGGGYDGTVVTGLGAVPRSPDNTPVPLARRYVTFGSDSGHEGNDASFAANQEALTNFAYAQLKKTHDAALALVKARYNRAPDKTYFAGQSEGGREGLTVAQRFPADYDGVIVTAPAIHFANIMMHFSDVAAASAQTGGFLTPASVKAFASAVLAQCDSNDGVADGFVGNYLGCAFDASRLRCGAASAPADGCFSDAQMHTLDTVYRPTSWKDASGKEFVSYPRYLVGGGEDNPGDMPAWITGRSPLPRPQPAGKLNAQQLGISIAASYSNSAVRYLIARDPALDTTAFVPQRYAKAIAAAVKLLASDDPNLAAFHRRGGKLIMLHNTADLAVSPVATIDYYEAVRRTLGAATARQFARLYIVPGGDHNGGNAPSKVDLLDMLDRWVVHGEPPGESAVAEEYNADHEATRSKPLCAYPDYPRYTGSGDKNAAGNYRCTAAR